MALVNLLEPLDSLLTPRTLSLHSWRFRGWFAGRLWRGRFDGRDFFGGSRQRRLTRGFRRGFDGLECLSNDYRVSLEQALDRLTQVFEQVPAIGNLLGFRCTFRCCLGVGRRTVPADEFNARMILEPLRDGVSITIRQEIDDVAPLQVHDDRAVALPFAPRPVVDTDEARRRRCIVLERFDTSEQRIRAGCHGETIGKTSPSFSSESKADGLVGLAKAVCGACIGGGKTGKALGEDAPRTFGRRAEEAANRDIEPKGSTEAREVIEPASVPTVNARSFRTTERANGGRRRGCEHNRQGVVIKRAMVKAAPGGSAKEFEWKQGEAPKMHIKLAKVSQVIHLLRWSIIESAGEPVLRAHFHPPRDWSRSLTSWPKRKGVNERHARNHDYGSIDSYGLPSSCRTFARRFCQRFA